MFLGIHVALVCDNLPNPPNGAWGYNNRINVVGTVISLQCNEGYIIDGEPGVGYCRPTADNIDAEFDLGSIGTACRGKCHYNINFIINY